MAHHSSLDDAIDSIKANLGKTIVGFIVVVSLLITWLPMWRVSQFKRQLDHEAVNSLNAKDKLRFEQDLLDAENRFRQTLAQIIGGFVLIFGLYLTWKGIKVNEEGKLTERFSKAIELLGNSDKVDIRVGGVYALERIANDSKTDYWAVIEVLTAFVRENRPLSGEATGQVDDSLPVDIQAALTVIGRRAWPEMENRVRRIDLSNARLGGANLAEFQLQFVNLSGSSLRGANLTRVNLQRADLEAVDLSGASLDGATFADASLKGSLLDQTTAKGVNFAYTCFDNTKIIRGDFTNSYLRQATFCDAQVTQSSFIRADFQGANLDGVLIVGGDFSSANFWGVDVSRANLDEANLTNSIAVEDIKSEPESTDNVIDSENVNNSGARE